VKTVAALFAFFGAPRTSSFQAVPALKTPPAGIVRDVTGLVLPAASVVVVTLWAGAAMAGVAAPPATEPRAQVTAASRAAGRRRRDKGDPSIEASEGLQEPSAVVAWDVSRPALLPLP
jgi:hypothetical protein